MPFHQSLFEVTVVSKELVMDEGKYYWIIKVLPLFLRSKVYRFIVGFPLIRSPVNPL